MNTQAAKCSTKTCRTCLRSARNCKSKWVHVHDLHRTFERATGLKIEDDRLPPYLCTECAQRLLDLDHFRGRMLQAHLLIVSIIKLHKVVTPKTVEATIGTKDFRYKKLTVKHNKPDHYDLEIQHTETVIDEKPSDREDITHDIIEIEDDSSKEDQTSDCLVSSHSMKDIEKPSVSRNPDNTELNTNITIQKAFSMDMDAYENLIDINGLKHLKTQFATKPDK